MNIHIYYLFNICTLACMGFVPENKLIRSRIRIRIMHPCRQSCTNEMLFKSIREEKNGTLVTLGKDLVT